MRSLLPLAIVALSLVLACAGGGGSPDGGDDDAGPNTSACQQDARVASYAAGMSLTSGDGGMTFSLESSDPAPPANENNTWMVKIVDAEGNPVTGATVSALPYMPYMGHGTSIHPEITEQGGGVYAIADLNLFMAGIWEVSVTAATASNGQGDTVSWFFCVAG